MTECSDAIPVTEESAVSDERENDGPRNKYRFMDGHPGVHFAFLSRLSHYLVPNICLPRGGLCRIRDLEIGRTDPSDECRKLRNDYAKTALLMGCPLRDLDDICPGGDYWEIFHHFVKQDSADRAERNRRKDFREIDFERYPEDSDLHSVQYCSIGKMVR